MNEYDLPGGSAPAGGISAPSEGTPQDQGWAVPVPVEPPKPGFSASRKEILAAIASYFLAWWYLWDAMLLSVLLFGTSDGDMPPWGWMLLFVLGFVGITEFLHWEQKRPRESWIWLGCLGIITLSILLGRDQVWDAGQRVLFLHLAAVYWLLCRSGRLAEGKSGRLLLLDGIHGFVVFPFYHFYLRIRCLWHEARSLARGRVRVRWATVLWSLLALSFALALFAIAVSLLSRADAGFHKLMGRMADWLSFDWDVIWLLQFLLSLPVGQFLFGLIAGSRREDPEILRERGRGLCAWVESLRKVPNLIWTALTGGFVLLYLAFFVLQGSYLFGAFTRTLPEGFIVSEYARQGFFELCRVMGLNFALLWLVTRMSRRPVREDRASLTLCLILLAESMLFAVVAFSKLALYIDCFGFTPLRLQSTWLVCVLFAGCLAFGWNLLSGRKTLRIWLVFSAVSLSLLCLV